MNKSISKKFENGNILKMCEIIIYKVKRGDLHAAPQGYAEREDCSMTNRLEIQNTQSIQSTTTKPAQKFKIQVIIKIPKKFI